MLRIYTASKLYMADAWKRLREQVVDVKFTARWPDQVHLEHGAQSSTVYERVWLEDHMDVAKADVVICYGSAEDILVGALIECGIAIGLDKTVIIVGDSKSFGTWQHHKNVYRAKTIMDAVDLAKELHESL